MGFKSVEEVLNFAIEREKDAVAFYRELYSKEDFPPAKETFKEFIGHEQKHVDLIEEFTKDKKTIDNYKIKNIQDLKISDYMVDVEYHEDMIYPDVLALAMKREEKAVKLYKELADYADTEEVAKLFKVLVNEESSHKNILEKIYDEFLASQDM